MEFRVDEIKMKMEPMVRHPYAQQMSCPRVGRMLHETAELTNRALACAGHWCTCDNQLLYMYMR